MSEASLQWLEVRGACRPRWALRMGTFLFSSWPLVLTKAYDWARGTSDTREVILVSYEPEGVFDASAAVRSFEGLPAGATGLGEVAYPPGQPVDTSSFARDVGVVVPYFHAILSLRAEQILAALLELSRHDHSFSPAQRRIRCGVVTAILRHAAVTSGVSVAELFAQHYRTTAREKVSVNGLIATRDLVSARADTNALIGRGFSTLKVKLHGALDEDIGLVRAVREAAPQVALRIDPNQSWEANKALHALESVGALDIEYVEDPLPERATLQEYAEFCRRSPVAIALDAPAASLESIGRIIDTRAAHVLVLKPQRLGGLDIAMLAALRANQAGFRVTLTGSLESAVGTCANLHLAAVLPEPLSACGLGTSMFFMDDFASMPDPINGYLRLANLPERFALPSR